MTHMFINFSFPFPARLTDALAQTCSCGSWYLEAWSPSEKGSAGLPASRLWGRPDSPDRPEKGCYFPSSFLIFWYLMPSWSPSPFPQQYKMKAVNYSLVVEWSTFQSQGSWATRLRVANGKGPHVCVHQLVRPSLRSGASSASAPDFPPVWFLPWHFPIQISCLTIYQRNPVLVLLPPDHVCVSVGFRAFLAQDPWAVPSSGSKEPHMFERSA